MLRFSFLLLLLIIGSTSFNMFADDEQLIKEVYVSDNDANYRYTYLYNEGGQKRLETKYLQSGSEWNPLSQIEWVFSNNNCVKHIEREWLNANWTDSYLIDFNYTNAVLTSEVHSKNLTPLYKKEFTYSGNLVNKKSEYSYVANNWISTSNTEYSYSSTEKPTIISQSIYNLSTQALIEESVFKYSYNDNDLLDSLLIQQEKTSDSFKNSELSTFLYDEERNLKLHRVQTWDSVGSMWTNSQKIEFEYDQTGKTISETYQKWDSQFWKNDLRYDYVYNTIGQLLQRNTSQSIFQEWRNINSVTYSDFEKGKACYIESKYAFWGGQTDELISTYIPYFFNDEITTKKGKTIRLSYLTTGTGLPTSVVFQTYPNPSDGIFYFDTQKHIVYSWSIIDLKGRVLKTQVQDQYSGVIDLTDLQKGIYILKVKTDVGELHEKLFKK